MTDNSRMGTRDGFRLTAPRTEEEIQALGHLSAEEKAAAVANLKKVPPSDGWFLLGNDPDFQGFYHIVERGILSLLKPEFQGEPGGLLNLICLEVARYIRCEWQGGIMATVTAGATGRWEKEDFDYAQLAMLDYPDSKLWTEKQRLILKYTRACLENSMTDELFNQARDTWGEKKMLRLIAWMGYTHTWAMIVNTCNLSWWEGPKPPVGEITPEMVKMFQAQIGKTWDGLQDLWNDETPMDAL